VTRRYGPRHRRAAPTAEHHVKPGASIVAVGWAIAGSVSVKLSTRCRRCRRRNVLASKPVGVQSAAPPANPRRFHSVCVAGTLVMRQHTSGETVRGRPAQSSVERRVFRTVFLFWTCRLAEPGMSSGPVPTAAHVSRPVWSGKAMGPTLGTRQATSTGSITHILLPDRSSTVEL
jgi:hypothetical protein